MGPTPVLPRLNSGAAVAVAALARRDRRIVATGVAIAAAAAWAWLLPTARDMYGGMTGPAAWMMSDTWDARYTTLIFLMWVVMMAGMMLPTAAPTILTFATIVRSRPEPEAPVTRTWTFASGYLVAWTAFSVAATALQWLLGQARLLSPMMESASAPLTGMILVVAGLYQWTPLKQACLQHCRSPIDYLVRHWRPGTGGALRMGMAHGLHCIGCCAALMLLLFVAGVMSMTAIVSITAFVLLEKVAPLGAHAGRVGGVLLVAMGVWFVI